MSELHQLSISWESNPTDCGFTRLTLEGKDTNCNIRKNFCTSNDQTRFDKQTIKIGTLVPIAFIFCSNFPEGHRPNSQLEAVLTNIREDSYSMVHKNLS